MRRISVARDGSMLIEGTSTICPSRSSNLDRDPSTKLCSIPSFTMPVVLLANGGGL